LLLAAGLIAVNAFFVVAEFSLVRVRPTRLRELAASGEAAAAVALRLIGRMDALLSTVQLGVTMASLGLGWAGEDTVAAILQPLLGGVPGRLLALAFAFLTISGMHIVFGELVPKSLALARADRLAMLVARPMDLAVTAVWPVMRFVNHAARRVARVFGVPEGKSGAQHQVHSPEELKMLIAAGREVGLLPAAQEAIIQRLFDLDQVLVREVMVPRQDMVCVPVTATLGDLVRKVQATNFSRLPVYEGTPEKIIGILFTKELFRAWAVQLRHGAAYDQGNFRLRQWLRAPMIVPDTKPLDRLFAQFRQERRQVALVVDEFGRIAGLVTLEDILEAVVGELEDELDVDDRPRMSPAEKPVDLDGATSLLDLEHLYGVTLPREHGFETLGGFTLWRLGVIPKGGEVFDFQGWRFTVLEMDRRRIAAVRVEKALPDPRPIASTLPHQST
jgi:putative hemolysin